MNKSFEKKIWLLLLGNIFVLIILLSLIGWLTSAFLTLNIELGVVLMKLLIPEIIVLIILIFILKSISTLIWMLSNYKKSPKKVTVYLKRKVDNQERLSNSRLAFLDKINISSKFYSDALMLLRRHNYSTINPKKEKGRFSK